MIEINKETKRMVDDITWVKSTVNRRLAKGHGFYLQHAKETCLVGKKGKDPPNLRGNIASDVIFSQRRGQSQKPTELYEIIEEMIPFGTFSYYYFLIFFITYYYNHYYFFDSSNQDFIHITSNVSYCYYYCYYWNGILYII